MAATKDEFLSELRKILGSAEKLDLSAVDLSSSSLHRRVGGYPGNDHRMPVCCNVMRGEMTPQDIVVAEPEKGAGATLVIRYQLPRS